MGRLTLGMRCLEHVYDYHDGWVAFAVVHLNSVDARLYYPSKLQQHSPGGRTWLRGQPTKLQDSLQSWLLVAPWMVLARTLCP